MKKRFMAFLAAAAMVVSLAGCGGAGTDSTPQESTETVGGSAESSTAAGDESAADTAGGSASDVSVILVTMDGLDKHWVNVDKGAQAAAEALGCNYQWMAPDRKDTALQIEMLNNAVAAQCDSLVVAAVDPEAIVSTIDGAKDAGVNVIYVDSTANTDSLASFTTDNYKAAYQAGEQMIKGLEEKGVTSGDIGIVAFSNATQTSIDREQGFRDALEDTEFNILETQYGNSEVAASQAAAENFISQGVVGVYGNNEPGAVGVGNAVIANTNWDGVAVGFDASDTTLDHVANDALYCVMAQNPYDMGYGAVEAAVKAALGETIDEKAVDTGAAIVDKTNYEEYRE